MLCCAAEGYGMLSVCLIHVGCDIVSHGQWCSTSDSGCRRSLPRLSGLMGTQEPLSLSRLWEPQIASLGLQTRKITPQPLINLEP